MSNLIFTKHKFKNNHPVHDVETNIIIHDNGVFSVDGVYLKNFTRINFHVGTSSPWAFMFTQSPGGEFTPSSIDTIENYQHMRGYNLQLVPVKCVSGSFDISGSGGHFYNYVIDDVIHTSINDSLITSGVAQKTIDGVTVYKSNASSFSLSSFLRQPSFSIEWEIDVNVPIFTDVHALYDYCVNGNIDPAYCLNCDDGINSVNTNKQWYITNQLKKNGSVVAFKNINFATLPEAKIYLSATTHDSSSVDYNMVLNITELPFKYINIGESMTTWAEADALTDVMKNYYYGDWTDFSTGDNYSVMLNTNIPIFAPEDAEKYVNGDIGIDASIGGGGVYNTSTIGTELTSTDIETSTFDSSASGSNVYLLSSADMREVKSYLFNPDQTISDSIKSGLALWGNSPISALISLYYVPFDVSLFYNVLSSGVKFGSHVAIDLGTKTLAGVGGKKVQIFSTSIEGRYGDYRDYLYTKYELYLPFVGNFISLDVNKYLNKIVSCEMLFDAYTHEVRYYIYADGIITDRVDTTVGTELALMSTDNVAKAKADVNASLGMVGNAVGIASGIASGNVGSVVGGVTGAISNSLTMQTAPSESVTGGYSSALNTYDIRYPYIRITEDLTLKPSNLNAKYNYPSYYIGSLGNLRGYCEIADCRIIGSATDSEKAQITNLLKNGVIF